MKNKINIIVMMIALLLFTNCKSSNVEPAPITQKIIIKNNGYVLKTLKIDVYNNYSESLTSRYLLNVPPYNNIEITFVKGHNVNLYVNQGVGPFSLNILTYNNNVFLKEYHLFGINEGGGGYVLQ